MTLNSIKQFFGHKKPQNINCQDMQNFTLPVMTILEEFEFNDQNEIVVKSIIEYKEALKKGYTKFDFSELEIEGQNIEDVDFHNCHLKIDLDKIAIPSRSIIKYSGSKEDEQTKEKEIFLLLNNTNLQGNTIIGEPKSFELKPSINVYICYSEETFDEEYKNRHPKYFLSKNAPIELKNKYYGYITKTSGLAKIIRRNTLTFEEYMKYYEFLHEKYLNNLLIENNDLAKIKLVENLGFIKAEEILIAISKSFIPISKSLEAISQLTDEELKQLSYNQSEQIKPDLELIETTKNQIRTRNK